MARLPRFVLAGHPQHVIIRGNNREPIFYADEDYRFYLDKLKDACIKHQCAIHAYVLMTNHVHLLITPQFDEVRMNTNKAWVLGSDYFKDKIAAQLNRRAKPNTRGGDRKSEAVKKGMF